MGESDLTRSIREMLGARPVVFVGMMGSGKSAIGRLFADELKLRFVDSDAEIVAAAGMSIPEIFEKFGEEHFRSGEKRVVHRLLAEGPLVLSLGGGAFIAQETRDEIAARGISVWLKADIDLLMSRVLRRPKARPLLQTPDPKATLAELLARREPVYRLADIHVESSRLSKRETRDDVLLALHDWLVSHPVDDNSATAGEEESVANRQG